MRKERERTYYYAEIISNRPQGTKQQKRQRATSEFVIAPLSSLYLTMGRRERATVEEKKYNQKKKKKERDERRKTENAERASCTAGCLGVGDFRSLLDDSRAVIQ